jgi:putative transposase
MLRVMKTAFRVSYEDRERLFACNRISAQVWNDCLHIAKAYAQEHGRWIGRTALQKATKGQYPIHSQSIQAVCHKYLQARDNTVQAKRMGHTHVRYPYRLKRHYPTKWAAQGFVIRDDGRIELSLGLREGKRQKPILAQVKNVPPGVVKEIELIYDRGLRLCISYDDGREPAATQGTQIAAVDPGEIHAIAAVTEDGEGLIVTGRKMRSIKRLRNKKNKELYRKMSKCRKGSRQWKRYRRALTYVLSKSECQLRDALHKTTRTFVAWCLENGVNEVVVGDVEGVQRGRSPRKRRTIGKRVRSSVHNQRMSGWPFGKQYAYMKYKLQAHGIAIIKQDERNTTQTCPVCPRKRKPSGRMYRCSCGYSQHRDIHGGCNILSVYKTGEIKPLVQVTRIKYLRIA